MMKNIFIILGSLDRRIIFIVIGLSVLIPLIKPEWVPFPVRPKHHSQIVFNELDQLKEGSKLLLSFEYGPSTKPEIHPMAIALIKHMFVKCFLIDSQLLFL